MIVLARLQPGDDLVLGIEALAAQHAMPDALIRCGPGSTMHCTLEAGGDAFTVPGPGVELLVVLGEVRHGTATLHGTVGDPSGRIHAGRFVRGRNPVCITVEFALEVG